MYRLISIEMNETWCSNFPQDEGKECEQQDISRCINDYARSRDGLKKLTAVDCAFILTCGNKWNSMMQRDLSFYVNWAAMKWSIDSFVEMLKKLQVEWMVCLLFTLAKSGNLNEC